MDEKKQNPGYSLDEILAETAAKKEAAKKSAASAPKTESPIHKVPLEEISRNPYAKENKKPSSQKPTPTPSKASMEKQSETQSQKKKKKKNSKDQITSGENDIYYGLKLKSREEYQREYEETMSFKPIRPEENPKGATGTFSYLFDPKRKKERDPELEERFRKLHQERRKRVEKVVQDPEQEDIFSITTAISLKEIQEAAAKRGSKMQYKPIEEKTAKTKITTTEKPVFHKPTMPLKTSAAANEKPVPVKEPTITPPLPHKESSAPKVEEPVTRPEPIREKSSTLLASDFAIKPVNKKVSYRYQTDPIHFIEVDDLSFPLKEAAKTYSKNGMPQDDAVDFLSVRRKDLEKVDPIEPSKKEVSAPAPISSAEVPKEKRAQQKLTEPIKTDEKSRQTSLPTPKPKKKKRSLFHLSGMDEPENDPSEEALPKEVQEVEDYSNSNDAPAIFHDLNANLRKLSLRLGVTGISTILLLIFGWLGEFGFFGFQRLNITVYLICNVIFTTIAFVFCGATIWNGLKSLFRFHANSDSAVAIAAIAALVQSIMAFFMQTRFSSGSLNLYASVATAALFLNTLGKFSMIKRINKNFHFVVSPDKKYAVTLFEDYNTGLQLADGCTMDTPVIAYQTETNFLSHFLRLSYEDDPSDRANQTIAPVAFLASLVLCIITLVLTKDVVTAFTAFAAATCITTPFMNLLAVNLPLARISRIASQCGGMVIGFPAVQHFCESNAVMMDSQDLFPKNTVILNGIKTFKNTSIDDSLMEAAALMIAAHSPLSSLFDQVIHTQHKKLPEVEKFSYTDGQGLSGWINGHRVFVGNRELLSAHKIEPPEEAIEQKYIQGGKKLVYLAIGGELIAMLIITYSCDRRRLQELRRMENNGISLILRNCDPNITPTFLAELFGLDPNGIRVLPERLGALYVSRTHEVCDEKPAMIATKGRPTALMRLVTACVRERGNISIAIVLQNVAVVLGFIMVALLTCYSGLQQISTMSLIVYEFFWAMVIWLVPKLRKP
ncbi:MAG: hypothetical protein LKJ50_06450 [Clostridiales bacterium]|jgi:hypothetical protein|nr:hypothetical protein [Clostridiales bacterium]MCI1961569.1 hypothetical protein [Clostridiales bacterium]MCI2022022.1 hypothetical protein [Clostridiales bacterium]MCI2025963.1 hypothetical protein [Clostridiales bacterium]